MMKITHWIFFTYIGVLILATALVPFVKTSAPNFTGMKQEDIDQAMSEFYQYLMKGKIDRIDDNHLIEEIMFEDFQSQTLRIESKSEFVNTVYVERMDRADAKIKAFIYSPGIIVDGVDLSEKLVPYKLQLADETLKIISPQQHIQISIQKPSFPLRPLTGETLLNSSFISGDQAIYLQIPKDLQIIADNNTYIEYVGE